jgi:hypothetical protein
LKSAQSSKLLQYCRLAACKNWEFLEQDKTSILILQLEPVLGQNMKNRKPRATQRSVTLSEHRRPTTPPAIGQRPPPLCRAHGFAAAAQPPPVSPPPPPRPQLKPPFPTASRGYKESTQGRRSSPFCHFRTHAPAPLCLFSATVVRQQVVTDVQPSRGTEPSSTGASTVSHADPCPELPRLPDAAAFFTAGSHRCHFPRAIPQP